MAYFSNGTEGAIYQERYCSRCWHDRDGVCPIIAAHLVYNYDECNKKSSILHILIPRSENGIGNEECLMFIPVESVKK